jgi:hypothetical protein
VLRSPTSKARDSSARYRIEECFSNFEISEGLTLPTQYDLRFTEELQNGFTQSTEWEISFCQIAQNIDLDPRVSKSSDLR